MPPWRVRKIRRAMRIEYLSDYSQYQGVFTILTTDSQLKVDFLITAEARRKNPLVLSLALPGTGRHIVPHRPGVLPGMSFREGMCASWKAKQSRFYVLLKWDAGRVGFEEAPVVFRGSPGCVPGKPRLCSGEAPVVFRGSPGFFPLSERTAKVQTAASPMGARSDTRRVHSAVRPSFFPLSECTAKVQTAAPPMGARSDNRRVHSEIHPDFFPLSERTAKVQTAAPPLGPRSDTRVVRFSQKCRR